MSRYLNGKANTFQRASNNTDPGLSSLGVPADQFTLSQPRGADYAHQIIHTGTPGFSDLPTPLLCMPAPTVEDSLSLEVNRKAYSK